MNKHLQKLINSVFMETLLEDIELKEEAHQKITSQGSGQYLIDHPEMGITKVLNFGKNKNCEMDAIICEFTDSSVDDLLEGWTDTIIISITETARIDHQADEPVCSGEIEYDPRKNKLKVISYSSHIEGKKSFDMVVILTLQKYIPKMWEMELQNRGAEMPLDEFNAIGTGMVAGGPQLPLGADLKSLHAAFWQKDKDKKIKTASPMVHQNKRK